MSDGSWPNRNRTATVIYNVTKALIMHNTERLHLPIIQRLANDNNPVFIVIDPYNAGTALHGHCGLLSTVLLCCGTQCGHCACDSAA
jgi:hypothetical protein